MTSSTPARVRAVRCDHETSQEDVYLALRRATDPLTDAWSRLARARRIGIKFNQDKQPHERVYFEGQLQQLVSEKVGRAVLRLLRERTDAELIAIDVSFYTVYRGARVEDTNTFASIFEEHGVRYVDGTSAPDTRVPVPGGGQMFGSYVLPRAVVDVDEMVSVATLKNHAFMGVTLSLKNLFGLMATEPHGGRAATSTTSCGCRTCWPTWDASAPRLSTSSTAWSARPGGSGATVSTKARPG
jgi:hypothetical protein